VQAYPQGAGDAAETSAKLGADFVDSYNFLTMKRHSINEIYSIDRHYAD